MFCIPYTASVVCIRVVYTAVVLRKYVLCIAAAPHVFIITALHPLFTSVLFILKFKCVFCPSSSITLLHLSVLHLSFSSSILSFLIFTLIFHYVFTFQEYRSVLQRCTRILCGHSGSGDSNTERRSAMQTAIDGEHEDATEGK